MYVSQCSCPFVSQRDMKTEEVYIFGNEENKTFLTCLFPGPAPKKHHNNSSLSICCRRFSRDTPSKNLSLKKKKNYILVRVFFAAGFPAASPSKKYMFKKKTYIFFSFFCRRFSSYQPSKNLSFKNIKLIYVFFHSFCRHFSRDRPSKKYKFKKKFLWRRMYRDQPSKKYKF